MTSYSTSRHPEIDGRPHVELSVFAGPDRDHRANVGTLVLRRGEEDELIRRIEDRYQPPSWLLALEQWLEAEGSWPLDFGGERIPDRLQALLEMYFHGADWRHDSDEVRS